MSIAELQEIVSGVSLDADRELSIREASFLRGISESTMKRRAEGSWKEAFFQTPDGLRTSRRLMRKMEDELAGIRV